MLKILLGSRAPLQAQYDWLNGDDRDTVIRDAFAAAVEELGGKFYGDPEASTPAAAALLPMIQGRLLLLAQQQFAPDQGEAAAHPALPDPADRTAGVSASPSS